MKMNRHLTKEETELLRKISEDKDLACTGFIKRFIIRNTYTPQHKVGEFVKITCPGEAVWGNPVRNVNGKIVDVSYMIGGIIDYEDICVQYEVEFKDNFGKTHTSYVEESVFGEYESRRITGPSDTDMNYFEKKSQYSQSTEVRL